MGSAGVADLAFLRSIFRPVAATRNPYPLPSSNGMRASFSNRALRLRPHAQITIATNAAIRIRRRIIVSNVDYLDVNYERPAFTSCFIGFQLSMQTDQSGA
jgi:hypothetical protein